MKQKRSKLTWFLIALLIGIAPAALSISGCAATQKSESTGQYIDDAAITGKIKAEILKDPQLKVFQIGVETFKGVVQLSGFVDSRESSKRAEDIAKSISGVVSVKNDLIVK